MSGDNLGVQAGEWSIPAPYTISHISDWKYPCVRPESSADDYMCWTEEILYVRWLSSQYDGSAQPQLATRSYDDRRLTHNAFDIMHIFSDIQQNGLDRSKNIPVCAGGVEISGTTRLSKKRWAVVACNYNQPGEFWSFEAVCAHRCQSQSDWCSEWDVGGVGVCWWADQQTRARSLWKRSCQWSCLLWLMLQRQSRGTAAGSVDCSAQRCVLPFTLTSNQPCALRLPCADWTSTQIPSFFHPLSKNPNTLRSCSEGATENGSH